MSMIINVKTNQGDTFMSNLCWRFNIDTLEFDEISDSKEVDEKGIEHPRESEIIKE